MIGTVTVPSRREISDATSSKAHPPTDSCVLVYYVVVD
jgi:hypothetical protein